MGLFVLGLSHHSSPVEVREKIHFDTRKLHEALKRVKASGEVREFLILSTCNRVELYGEREKDGLPEEFLLSLLENVHEVPRSDFKSHLYHFVDEEVVRHLFRVASGLDSLVLGESEILGQLREAFRMASETGSVQGGLYRLVEKALQTGKKVRTQTKLGEGAVSVPSVASEVARKIFGNLKGRKAMVLGAGEMGVLTLKHLRSSGASVSSVVTSSHEKGGKLTAEFGGKRLPFEEWKTGLREADIVIASTSCPHTIVHLSDVKEEALRRRDPLLLIDIAVPRNIAPEIHGLDNVYLYNIDDLKSASEENLGARQKEIHLAREIVEEAARDYQAWRKRLEARPALERFESFLDEILEKELGPFAEEWGASEESRRRIQERIRAKLMHLPHERMKKVSEQGGVERYLEVITSLFDLDRF